MTTFNIFLGDNKTMNMRVVNSDGTPFALTAVTNIDVSLPNADGTFTERKLSLSQVTIVSSILGQFAVPISSLVSAFLNVGELQDVDVTFTLPSTVFTVRFFQALSVFQRADYSG